MPSGPRSVQHNMPSPSTSVRSAVTAPAQTFFDRSGFQQSNIASVESRIDPSLPGLDMHLAPSGHVARTNYNIERSYHEDSWNPLHLRNSSVGDGRMPHHQANASFKPFRTGPGSVGSAAPVSDSGFYSQSAVSNDASRLHQSRVPSCLTQQAPSMNVRSTPSEALDKVRVPSDQRSQISHISSRNGKQGNELECRECHEISKCKSDYKCVLLPL